MWFCWGPGAYPLGLGTFAATSCRYLSLSSHSHHTFITITATSLISLFSGLPHHSPLDQTHSLLWSELALENACCALTASLEICCTYVYYKKTYVYYIPALSLSQDLLNRFSSALRVKYSESDISQVQNLKRGLFQKGGLICVDKLKNTFPINFFVT